MFFWIFLDFFEIFLWNFQLTFDTFSFEIDGTSAFNRKKPVLIDCIRRLSFEFAISRRVFLSSAFLSPSLLPIWTRDDRLLNSCMSCIVAIPPTKPAFICFSRKSSLLSLFISDKIQFRAFKNFTTQKCLESKIQKGTKLNFFLVDQKWLFCDFYLLSTISTMTIWLKIKIHFRRYFSEYTLFSNGPAVSLL